MTDMTNMTNIPTILCEFCNKQCNNINDNLHLSHFRLNLTCGIVNFCSVVCENNYKKTNKYIKNEQCQVQTSPSLRNSTLR